MKFELLGKEYIELNRLLKLLRLVGSGGEANQCIMNGEVEVNENIELQKRKKIRIGDKVNFNHNSINII